jgi:hypothetical protein
LKICYKKPVIIVFIWFVLAGNASGWYDETHIAVSKAAGYNKWYNSTGADIAKIKAFKIERYNHFFNNPEKFEVTPEIVLDQVKRYNSPYDSDGHIYGAIIASLREYKKGVKKGRYAEYHFAFCVHYIADLSQPLHNIPFDVFNKRHHFINDGIVNDEVLANIFKIRENMYSIRLRSNNFEKDLAREIARIANGARRLGYTLKKENRDLTEEEAYMQLGHSASLIKAILKYLGKI